MKKQIFLAIAALLVFGLGAAALAYQTTNDKRVAAMSCCDKDDCCKGDTCPKKGKDEADKDKASCGDKDDCCKGNSCPIKKKGEKPQTAGVDMKNVTVVSGDEGCCPCCGAKKDG